jgi:iron complex transport system ATP-binding protein
MTAVADFDAVDFTYRSRGTRPGFAIRDLSFSVEAGEILGIIGPNASGKTTLIRLLTKVLTPARGEVRLDGESLSGLSRAAVATRVAVVSQSVPRGFPHSVEDLVVMGRFPHAPRRLFETDEDWRHAHQAMAAVGLLSVRAAALDDLSEGERQRAMLARAVCQGAPLLVLDEPTAHLDLRYQAEFVALLRRLTRGARLTVVLVSHDLNLAAELCDRLLLLESGRSMAIGAPEAVLVESTLEAVYGCRVIVDKHPVSGRPSVQIAWPDPEGG